METTFVHLTDTHLGPDSEFEADEGLNNYDRTWRVIRAIKALPNKPDFAVHTGDVSHRSHFARQGAYELGKKALDYLGIPYYVGVGNHDDPPFLDEMFAMPGMTRLHTPGRFDFKFEAAGLTGIFLDARVDENAKGSLFPSQLARLPPDIGAGKPYLLFLHYLPVDVGVPWYLGFDTDYGGDKVIVENHATLGDVLARDKTAVRGVFFGHVHYPRTFTKNGILYATPPSVAVQFAGHSGALRPAKERDVPPGFNVVHIKDDLVSVTTHYA